MGVDADSCFVNAAGAGVAGKRSGSLRLVVVDAAVAEDDVVVSISRK